jgi:peptide/nickel transport system ATP-binding protein
VTADIPLLTVNDLTVEFATRRGKVQAVQQVNVTVAKGETLGIVGESGSGKSVTSYAVMRILDRAGRIAGGSIMFGGVDVGTASETEMRDLRGREISMIFQNPRAALNPIRKVGKQIEDILLHHVQAARSDVKARAIDTLRRVRIANPEERYHAYPFELSGGMCQRVVIALALACRPQLLIADEPTTGLDVTTQKAVMDLVVDLTRERGMSTILITHDLGLAATYCDRVVVMEKGKVVETAPSRQIFAAPQHPYTRKLMKATPRLGIGLRDLLPVAERSSPPLSFSSPSPRLRGEGASPQAQTRGEAPSPGAQARADLSPQAGRGETHAPFLTVENLVKEYPRNGMTDALTKLFGRKGEKEQSFRAVGGISFAITRGESVGLVGESGCGKSTTSMMVMRLIDKTSGTIEFDGEDIGSIPAKQFATHPARKRIQMVFQDPTDSLNPRFTAARAIADPLVRLGGVKKAAELRARCEDLATQVGLPIELLDRFPHQLSGGQKARVGIARAIALRPDLVVLDEPTAALDVSVQAVVLNLLQDLKALLGMSYLFVSHDLNVVRLLCDRVIVMQAGEIVEQGSSDAVLGAPKTGYVRELLAAIPHPPT